MVSQQSCVICQPYECRVASTTLRDIDGVHSEKNISVRQGYSYVKKICRPSVHYDAGEIKPFPQGNIQFFRLDFFNINSIRIDNADVDRSVTIFDGTSDGMDANGG